MAMALARLGYRALIIEGNAQENQLFNLVIDADGEARLEEAQAYKGTRNYALAGAVRSFPKTGQPSFFPVPMRQDRCPPGMPGRGSSTALKSNSTRLPA